MSVSELPAPLVPAGCDCTDLDGFMLNVERLMASELVALSSHEVVGAALFLWCRAWKQIPAASLPDDERVIAAYAKLPMLRFRKLRDEVLRGFVKCSDGRLYHRTLAAEAAKAFERKSVFQRKRDADAKRLREWRASQTETHNETGSETQSETRFNENEAAPGENTPKSRRSKNGAAHTIDGPSQNNNEINDTPPIETLTETRFVAEGQGQGQKKKEKRAAQPVERVSHERAPDIDLDDVAKRLLTAAKPGTWPLAACPSLAPIPRLIADGCDLDRDVLPAIATAADAARRAGKKISTWSYFANAITEARDDRIAGKRDAPTPRQRPEGAPDDWPECFPVGPDEIFAWWRKGKWFPAWGPRPDFPGCVVPKRILDEWESRAKEAAE